GAVHDGCMIQIASLESRSPDLLSEAPELERPFSKLPHGPHHVRDVASARGTGGGRRRKREQVMDIDEIVGRNIFSQPLIESERRDDLVVPKSAPWKDPYRRAVEHDTLSA